MNKLTEIKQTISQITDREEIEYLLSLLEEKDKALAFYADKKTYKRTRKNAYVQNPAPIENDGGETARKALNTSSNNEGEV